MVRERARLGRLSPLTLFAAPKSFTGAFEAIQRRAVTSWTLLPADVEVVLVGDEPGIAEAAAELGCVHVAEVERTSEGTPIVGDVFERAQRAASHDVMCYLNADIVLAGDLPEAATALAAWGPAYMASGRRTDVDLPADMSFEPGWRERLRDLAREHGTPATKWYMDYFVFPRQLVGEIPPFAIGRPGWDNWLLWYATTRGAEIVDATDAVLALHQTHDYSHVDGGKAKAYQGAEAARNLELMGGRRRNYNLMHARYVLTAAGEIEAAPRDYSAAVRAQRWRPWRRRLRLFAERVTGRGRRP